MTRTDGRPGHRIVRRLLVLCGLAVAAANAAGAVVVFVLIAFVLPVPPVAEESRVIVTNLVLASAYAVLATGVGLAFGLRDASRRLAWLRADEAPDDRDRRRTLRIPLASTVRQLVLWFLAAGLFGTFNAFTSVLLGVEVGLAIAIAGLTVTATTYRLLERIGRPAVARALADRRLHRAPGAGVVWQTVMTWGLGTGLPLIGLTLLSGLSMGLDVERVALARAGFVLGLTALATGLLATLIQARSHADPLKDLRLALERIERGELRERVPISTTTEVAVVQSGINFMAEGLAERERIREVFGRHVGHDVASQAIEQALTADLELGGEERDAVALFVDLVDSTGLAERLGASEVLGLLNGVFGVVVDVVDAHGGVVNGFQGDAALAVWGAPLQREDQVDQALRAARSLCQRLAEEGLDVRAGIGVAGGRVVAGNLGASSRMEYTVIGDPVNLASRLSGLAKDHDPPVLADADLVARAGEDERRRWTDAGEATVRGRSTPTRLVRPAPPDPTEGA